MKPKISEEISKFLKFIAEAQKLYEIFNNNVSEEEKLTQDLLHSLELDNLKRDERSKLATKLAKNRRDRRYYKDGVEELQPIIDFMSRTENKKAMDTLTHVLGDVRKAEKYHENRFYIPKSGKKQ